MRVERWLSTVPLRLRSLFRRADVDAELDDELRYHLDRQIEQGIARGLSPEEARAAARRAFGGMALQTERCRDARRLNLVDDLAKDVRFALRLLARRPGFAAAAILSLALGIGANTAIFSVVHAVVLKPLPYKAPERLVVVGEGGGTTASAVAFLEWRTHARAFERLGAGEYWTPNLAGQGRTEQVFALHLSADMFPLLGVDPLVGRVFGPDEEHAGRDRVVVIGYRAWQTRFGGDPAVVGRTLRLDGDAYTIVGVMPAHFRFAPYWATRAELWAPLSLDARKSDTGGSLRVFGRLAPGVSLPQARADVMNLSAALATRVPQSGVTATVTPLHTMVVGDVALSLWVLLAATGFVLLIACANVAHLQLVRAAARQREIAVRTALGASRARVVRQLLTESALLCVGGAALGLLLAFEGVRLLVALAPPSLPRVDAITLDRTALGFMLASTLVSCLAFGLVPSLKGSSVDLNEALKEGSRGSTDGARRTMLRSVLVVSEFAMALMLLVAAGLLIRSFVGLLGVNSGFDPKNLVAMEVSAAGTRYADPSRRPAFFREMADRVRQIPGVESASAINHLPLVGDTWGFPFAVAGRPAPRPEDQPRAVFRVVMPGYFQTMRLGLIAGRDFTDRDVLDAPHVAIVSEFMARKHWPGQDPIGQRIAAGDLTHPDWCTVVGVVRDGTDRRWSEGVSETMYFPYLQSRMYLTNPRSFAAYMTLVARASSSPSAVLTAADGAIRGIDRDAVVTRAIAMERAIAAQFAQPRFYLLFLGIFASIALVLAAVGIYGVMSHGVAERRHEIGVRLALGAAGRDVLALVLGQGLRLAATGTAIGIVGGLALTRYMRTLLFGVEPADPLTFVAVTAALGAVALGACYLPARRAMRVDPMTAVRCD